MRYERRNNPPRKNAAADSGIPTLVSSDEIINQLHDKISELNDEIQGMYLQPIMNAADTYPAAGTKKDENKCTPN